MKSALALVFGLSAVALSVGCDNATTPDDGNNNTGGKITLPQGGTGNTATGNTASGGTGNTGTGNTATGGTGNTSTGGGSATEGVPLTPADGWVDAGSNALCISGAMFSYGDDTSKMGMMEDFTGAKACISGTAAKVDTACTPVAPATDCYGTFWGAAIGLNLNQPIDPVTEMGVDPPLTFDATHIKGFSFTVAGATIPTTLRFKVEDGSAEYCTWKTILDGPNTVLFSELETKCWEHSKGTGTSATTAQAGLIKIAWQVVTVTAGTTAFDFCVSDVRAITDGTPPPASCPGVSTGGSSSGGSSSGGTPSGGTPSGGSGGASGGTGGASGGSGGSGGG